MATAEAKIQVSEFTNEPFIDFSKPENRSAMEAALKKVASEFGREYPMYIAGQKVVTAEKRTSTNPSHPEQVIGVFQNRDSRNGRASRRSRPQSFRLLEARSRRAARRMSFPRRQNSSRTQV